MNWPERTLGDVCEINPRLPRDHGLMDDTPVSFVPMAAVDEVSGVVRDKQQRPFLQVKKGYTSFRDGDVLFAKITPCMENGKAAVASDLLNGVGFGSTEFHVLRAKTGVLAEWIYYFVRREPFRREAKRNFTGTAGQQRVPATFLGNCRIHIPPLDEQRRIIDLLSRAEGIVRLRREAQKKAAEIIPALFLDMFGDPATNPMGWAETTLGNVVDEFRYGTSQKSGTLGLPTLRIPNVIGDRLDPTEIKLVSVPDVEANRLRLRDGDFLFVRTNGNPDYVGRSAVYVSHVMRNAGFDGDNCLYASYLIRARLKLDSVNPRYLQSFLSTSEGRKRLREQARTSAGQYNINTEGLASIRISLPSIQLQTDFEERCRPLFGLRDLQSLATAKAEGAFSALVARTFSGAKQAHDNPVEVAVV